MKADEKTKDVVWQLLRELEEKCGNSAGPLDADLIRYGYRWMNEYAGYKGGPVYVDRPKPDTPS